MNILIIGGGGREHALGRYLAQDPRVTRLYFAPGNGGTEEIGDNRPFAELADDEAIFRQQQSASPECIGIHDGRSASCNAKSARQMRLCMRSNLPIQATDLDRLLSWAKETQPDLTIVGPENPLCLGVVDLFQAHGLKIFGPTAQAAQLEESKIFSKELLIEAGAPTAASQSFETSRTALDYLKSASFPVVIKAEGLAFGKGVVVAHNQNEAAEAIRQMLDEKTLGSAADRILIEEFLQGEELSILAVSDGSSYQLLPAAQDYKRLLDGNAGPNTGGVGAYAPAPLATDEVLDRIRRAIFDPVFAALKRRNILYHGILYAGLMMTEDGPKVLEFNARFGDPETQVMLPLLETPLLDILLAVVDRKLDQLPIRFKPGAAVSVVLTAAGYPQKPEKGRPITFSFKQLDPAQGELLFHAGTSRKEGRLYTSGGRVLCATGYGKTLESARKIAYELVSKIQFEGMHFRRDIADRASSAKKNPCATDHAPSVIFSEK